MKSDSLIKSGVGLLLVVGALSPVVAVGEEGTEWSYREGALYENVRNAASAPGTVGTMSGAQGPIRTESMEAERPTGEGYFYDHLRDLQASTTAPSSTVRGAQGPIRTDGGEATWSYTDGALYDNLRNQLSR